jgi:hypothetical protein
MALVGLWCIWRQKHAILLTIGMLMLVYVIRARRQKVVKFFWLSICGKFQCISFSYHERLEGFFFFSSSFLINMLLRSKKYI